MPTLTGLSLSFCVGDIARGLVREEDVVKIIAATCAPDAVTFEEVLASYSETYWADCAEKAREIARRMYNKGKIDQPRTRGEGVYYVGAGCWMDESRNTLRINSHGRRQYSGEKAKHW